MTLRLSDDETEALRRAAEAEGRSMQDVARTAIRDYVSARESRVQAMLTAIAARDAEILERLGS